MTVNILFAARHERWAEYKTPLRTALDATQVPYNLATDLPPADVDYIVYAPNSPVQDFSPYTKLKAVLNLWAGVENVVDNTTLTVPLARMVDPGMTRGMVEYVLAHTMRYHMGLDPHITNTTARWAPKAPPLATERQVTVLGLGELGAACATAIARLGFHVTGWSRNAKTIADITTHAGADGLKAALQSAEILILLLPDTPATQNILNAESLAQLPRGARIINPGRGTLIDDDALLATLNSGHVAHATLDVFRTEPLPADDPYWAHSNVTVTPHIASETRAATASQVIAENVRRGETGQPFLHLVDRAVGY